MGVASTGGAGGVYYVEGEGASTEALGGGQWENAASMEKGVP